MRRSRRRATATFRIGPRGRGPVGRRPEEGPIFPTIAIVDSGVQSRSDFGRRLIRQVDLTTARPEPSAATASVTARSSRASLSVMPTASRASSRGHASCRSMSSTTRVTARVSDLLAACDWILQNKNKYNIDVANFSLNASSGVGVQNDPLDKAVEKLWLNGVVVVAAAGNYASDGAESGVGFAPANDPFVITVGASDTNGTVTPERRLRRSVVGVGIDTGRLPQAGARGTRAVLNGPVPMDSTMFDEQPVAESGRRLHVDVGDIVRRAARVRRGRHVALAASGLDSRSGQGCVDGGGERSHRLRLDGRARSRDAEHRGAIAADGTANPNAGLDRFVSTDPATGLKTFDATGWAAAAMSDPAWNAGLVVERELVVGVVVERELVVGLLVERELVVRVLVERELVVGLLVEHVRGR